LSTYQRSRRLSPRRSRISRSPASLNPRLHRPRRSPSPIPVTVINWPAALRPVQAAPPAADERVEPVEEEEDIDKEFEDEPEREPAPALPKSSLPVAPKPETPVAVVDVPEIPEPDVPDPLPTLTIVWPDLLATLPGAQSLGARCGRPGRCRAGGWGFGSGDPGHPRTDDRVAGPPEDPDPEDQIPDIVAAAMPPDPDAGATGADPRPYRWGRDPRSGRTRTVTRSGETLFRTWNRRTGGALNG